MFNKKRGRRDSFVSPKIHTRTTKENNFQFNAKYVWVVLVLVLIGVIVWWLFYSDFFKIKNIIVDGEINENVQNEIDKLYGENILLFVIDQTDKDLANRQASIEKLNIVKGIPDTLKIEIKVRDPMICWKTQDNLYYIDKYGIVFDLDTGICGESLVTVADQRDIDVEIGAKIVTNDFVTFVRDLYTRIDESIDKEIDTILINDTTFNIELKFTSSYSVYFDVFCDVDYVVSNLSQIIARYDSDIKEYVDMRVEGKAYYK
jgi:cell division septal protein FtsQ